MKITETGKSVSGKANVLGRENNFRIIDSFKIPEILRSVVLIKLKSNRTTSNT